MVAREDETKWRPGRFCRFLHITRRILHESQGRKQARKKRNGTISFFQTFDQCVSGIITSHSCRSKDPEAGRLVSKLSRTRVSSKWNTRFSNVIPPVTSTSTFYFITRVAYLKPCRASARFLFYWDNLPRRRFLDGKSTFRSTTSLAMFSRNFR